MNEVLCVCVCVVGVPDCHRGSSQAGSAGIRTHVCSRARRSLFHLIRSPHARGLWVWLHCQVGRKSKRSKINCGIYLNRIPTGEHAGCSKVMVWRLCGVTRPLSPCLNLYVTQESTWDTNHAWKGFSFFVPLNLFLVFHPHLLFVFFLFFSSTWQKPACYFLWVVCCLKNLGKPPPPTVPVGFSFILSISRAWHFRGNQGKDSGLKVRGTRNGEEEGYRMK